jgi:hypothetical protein
MVEGAEAVKLLDPSKLKPDEKVILFCDKGRAGKQIACRFFDNFNDSFAFVVGEPIDGKPVLFLVAALDDGTLRDDEGRIVQVFEAVP